MAARHLLVDATAALIFDRSDVRRHLVLHHPGELERARRMLRLYELRDRRASRGGGGASSPGSRARRPRGS